MHGAARAFACLLCGLLAFLGAGLILYPTAAQAVNEDQMRSYARTVEQAARLTEEEAHRAIEEARSVNERLAARGAPVIGTQGAAPEGYWEWSHGEDGVVASVEIPALDLELPVRLGTSDEVLARGVGHIPGTSLPVGGPSTNCVLAGHTSYRDARLFSDIGELGIGEEVTLRCCGLVMRYEVVDSFVIEPDDVGALAIEPGRDLLTLLTCYPPEVNTQRLIVVCERSEAQAPSGQARPDGQAGSGGRAGEGAQAGDAIDDAGASNKASRTGHMPGWVVAGLCLIVCASFGMLVPLTIVYAGMRLERSRPARGPNTPQAGIPWRG